MLALVTAQNGRLSAQGDPGKGPLFTLYFPAATLGLAAPPDPIPSARPTLQAR